MELADGVDETHENELQARWDRFVTSIAKREAEGWVYDPDARLLRNPRDGEKVAIVPPPKPKSSSTPRPGARATLGKMRAMRLADYVTAVMVPSLGSSAGAADARASASVRAGAGGGDGGDRFGDYNTGDGGVGGDGSAGGHGVGANKSHPEKRYVFNTFKDCPLHADFAVPELLQQISVQHSGRFVDVPHPHGTALPHDHQPLDYKKPSRRVMCVSCHPKILKFGVCHGPPVSIGRVKPTTIISKSLN